jgi:hypothetical protein
VFEQLSRRQFNWQLNDKMARNSKCEHGSDSSNSQNNHKRRMKKKSGKTSAAKVGFEREITVIVVSH